MSSGARTAPRPPRIGRRPCLVALSLATGATPTQAGDLAAGEGAEFGQLGEQGGDEHGSDAGHALQQGSAVTSGAIGRDGLPDQLCELLPLGAQAAKGGLGALTQGWWSGEMAELLAAGGDLGRELAAVGQQLGQDLPRAGDRRGRCRPGKGAIARDHRGIDAVGFGQAAARPGKGAHPRGVDDRDRHVALAEQALRQALVAARGLHDQQIPGAQVEPVGELPDTGGIIGDRQPPPSSRR